MWRYSAQQLSRYLQRRRFYCSITKANEQNSVSSSLSSVAENSPEKPHINYKELKYETKVPLKPIKNNFIPDDTNNIEEISIDSNTIQLLERLSLVDLDSKEALKTLKDSIQFANKIAHIDTTDVEPLYTVLENEILSLREDIVTEGDCKDDILRNAMVTEEDYFVAPPGNIPLEQEEKRFD